MQPSVADHLTARAEIRNLSLRELGRRRAISGPVDDVHEQIDAVGAAYLSGTPASGAPSTGWGVRAQPVSAGERARTWAARKSSVTCAPGRTLSNPWKAPSTTSTVHGTPASRRRAA
jgi:hypothetical protein